MLLNVLLHYYVTAESYLHYNKGIFYKMLSSVLHAEFGAGSDVLSIDRMV